LASIFGLSVQETADQSKDTLIDIVSSSAFERHRNDPTGLNFYPLMLADKKIRWNTFSKKLIQILLILPIGSADAERGFSIYKHIKFDRRARLGEIYILILYFMT
jgi:hypothetical protein